jgi:hypothetical protein
MINYILVLLVSFLGLFVGNILGLFAKEELKPGKKWFELLEKIIFILILIVFTFYFVNVDKYFLVFILILTVYFRISKVSNSFVYLMLALMFYFTSNSNVFLIIASLIFLYGLPIGSLMTKGKELKVIKEILLKYGFYVIAGLILPLFISYL